MALEARGELLEIGPGVNARQPDKTPANIKPQRQAGMPVLKLTSISSPSG